MGWDRDRTARVREYLEHRAEEQYGVWIDDLAAHGLDDDAGAGDEVVFSDGYDALASHFADGLDIRLSHVVTHIRWDIDGVVVTHRPRPVRGPHRGTRGARRRPPVLRPDDRPAPAVDERARTRPPADECLREGRAPLPHRFWPDDVYAIRRQGPDGRRWRSWYDLTRLHGEPTLLTFAAGPTALETRSWDDPRLVESTLAHLRHLYGDDAPAPVAVHRTDWLGDPCARGSHAYMSVGASTADHDDLATPIGDVLHLAGEATWTDDPATVPAAMLSGHRAACRVLGHPVAVEALWAGGASTMMGR